MIKARIFRSSENNDIITGFAISRHAGYAEEGSDIICAAVSAIAYAACGYFEEKRFDGGSPDLSETDGHMLFTAPETRNERDADAAQAVLEAMTVGLKQIELSYGRKYIRVID